MENTFLPLAEFVGGMANPEAFKEYLKRKRAKESNNMEYSRTTMPDGTKGIDIGEKGGEKSNFISDEDMKKAVEQINESLAGKPLPDNIRIGG